jgi:hypothetical protein
MTDAELYKTNPDRLQNAPDYIADPEIVVRLKTFNAAKIHN